MERAGGAMLLTPGAALGQAPPMVDKDGKEAWPNDVEDVPIPSWDSGVFVTELMNLKMLPPHIKVTELSDGEQEAIQANPETLVASGTVTQNAPEALREGTWRGTQLALTKYYDMIESNYKSFMDASSFESTFLAPQTLAEKRQLFVFTNPNPSDNFPPHLNLAANKPAAEDMPNVQKSTLSPVFLFNAMRLAQLSYLLPALMPQNFLVKGAIGFVRAGFNFIKGGMGTPDQGSSIREVEDYNRAMRTNEGLFGKNDIFNLPNMGDLPDWYSDERFAQQHFTGTNPTTIEVASDFWIKHFIGAARSEDQAMRDKIQRLATESKGSLYMQDYSYFRKAAGMKESDVIFCEYDETYVEETDRENQRIRKARRYGVAAVCLFQLNDDGKLKPLAIVCDWRGSAEKSITIYNKELELSAQREDWPWRYAKTCVQTSDWMRHEVTVHLTNTHLIEEATIVGAQRSFENNHPVFQLLYPHWQKTLALNAAARVTLVPHVIIALIGLKDQQAYQFIQNEFNSFDFEGRYVPKDLKRRGFDPAELDSPKLRNYAYARCIHSMWFKIRSYVEEMLAIHYQSDADVVADRNVKMWYEVMQAPPADANGGAGLKSFPTITTFAGLVDAVTMCIHLASPQHTSVNYLQNYYQSFVINKPACLYTPLPSSIDELLKFQEKDLVAALPMNHPQEWLLASHIPYLLSFKPGDKESLIIYAASKYHVYKAKREPYAQKIREAAARFYGALQATEAEFKAYGDDVWDSATVRYDVLSPSWNAVSILI